MRVLGVLAAWGVLAVLATMCFALGGSIGYRRGVRDTVAQIRERRAGKAGCRPLPANHLRRRSSGHLRPGARARRARWRTGPSSAPVAVAGASTATGSAWSVLTSSRTTSAVAACIAGLLLIGVPVTAVGASTAGPEDRMYGAKLALEQVRLAAAMSPERKAQAHVDLARARLTELSLLDAGDAEPEVIHRVVDEVEVHYDAVKERTAQIDEPVVRETLARDIAAVASSQAAVVDTMVAATGCEERTDGHCEELAQTQRETAALQTDSVETVATVATDDVVVASSDVGAVGDDAATDVETSEANDGVDGDAATSQHDDTGAEQPSASAEAGEPAAAAESTTAASDARTSRDATERATASATKGKKAKQASEPAAQKTAKKAASEPAPKKTAKAANEPAPKKTAKAANEPAPKKAQGPASATAPAPTPTASPTTEPPAVNTDAGSESGNQLGGGLP